jgi:hypothetical protein
MTHPTELKRHVLPQWVRLPRHSPRSGADEPPADGRQIDPRRPVGQATMPKAFSVTAVESL